MRPAPAALGSLVLTAFCLAFIVTGCISPHTRLLDVYESLLSTNKVQIISLELSGSGQCQAVIQVEGNDEIAAIRHMPFTSLEILGGKRFSDLSLLTNMPLTSLELHNTAVKDLSPIQGMPLTNFSCFNTPITDITSLKGMPLRRLEVSFSEVTNWNALSGMPLEDLDVTHGKMANLELLRGMKLSRLNISLTQVTDLSPVKGMPLTVLDLEGCPVTNLAPLADMPLRELNLEGTEVSDLSPLKGMPLTIINLQRAKVSDLSPLSGMPIVSLRIKEPVITETKITDISALKGMRLKALDLRCMNISDLSPLRGMKLEELDIAHTQVKDLSPLKGMPLRRLDLAGCTNLQSLAGLEHMPLEILEMYDTGVTNLQPLKKSRLKELWVGPFDGFSGSLTDLSPLHGLPLTKLNVSGTQVSDLSPLKGMPLKEININATSVTDLSPLGGLKLERLEFSAVRIQKGMEIIRSMKSLKDIAPSCRRSTYSPDAFWALYDKGEYRFRADIVDKVEWNGEYAKAAVSPPVSSGGTNYVFARPVALAANRIAFLDALASSAAAPAIELLRQYIYDPDPTVQKHAFVLLEQRKDIPSLFERFILNHAELSDDSEESTARANAFLESISDSSSLKAMISHSEVKKYRSEFPSVSTWKLGETRLPPDYWNLSSFGVKQSIGSGGCQGVVDETRVAFRKGRQEDIGSPWRSIGRPEEGQILQPGLVYRNLPLTNAWARTFGKRASAPCCHKGKFFMADGDGNLICGHVETGEIVWRVPLPLPPFAQCSVQSNALHVVFSCDLATRLDCTLDPGSGNLIGVKIEQHRPGGKKQVACEFEGYRIRCQQEKESTSVICSREGKDLWVQKVDCTIQEVLVRAGRVFLFGSWGGPYKALASLDVASGSVQWALPLVGSSGDFRLSAEDALNFWFFDEDSYLKCVDKTTGDVVLAIRMSDTQYSLPMTALSLDPATDRLLIDPSYGVVYSIPRSAFFHEFAEKTPLHKKAPFGYVFRKEVLVAKSDLVIHTEEESDSASVFSLDGGSHSHQLFETFASTFAGARFYFVVDGWFERWKVQELALIDKAKTNGFDPDELRTCLSVIAPKANDRTAITPVSAYRIRFNDEDAWVIVCKWEYSDNPKYTMGHVRIWAISPKTRKILAFATCG